MGPATNHISGNERETPATGHLKPGFYGRLLLLLVLLISSLVSAQAQNLNRLISIKFTNITLEEAFERIEKQSDILFSYNPRKIPAKQKVSVDVTNKPVKEVLDGLLLPLKLTYFISGHHVVVKQSNNMAAEAEEQFATPATYTISGFLSDSTNGEMLIGAAVYDKESQKGAITNAYGFYSLTLAAGNYTITYSLIGYRQLNLAVKLDKDIRLNLQLPEISIVMDEVIISGNNEIPVIDSKAGGEVHLSTATLKRMAGFAGNVDVIKSLQSVPGISGFGDGSSFYYVRGGDKDQNLMLIDEAPIFNPAHLFGFFSALAPDAIKDVRAFKGDLPAAYGGRLSSVIDIRARDGNMNNLGFSGNLGIFTSDLTVEGPLIKEKSSFILSARRSNLNWLTKFDDSENRRLSVDFYDLNAKLNIRLNHKNRLFLTGFTGKDDFSRLTNASVNTYGLSWDNATATLRWNHLFNNRLFINTTALSSRYNYYLFMSRELDDYWTSSISTKTLKSDLTWFIRPGNTFRSGIELSRYHSNPGNVHFSDNATQQDAPEISPYNSLGISYYASSDRMMGDRFTLRAGLRLSSWRNLGPATVYFFDATYKPIDTVKVADNKYYSPFFNAEPRISIAYRLSKKSTLSAGYSATVQYLNMLSNSTSPFTSLEVWASAGKNILPQKADHFTFGYQTGGRKIHFSLEAYYKLLYHQIDYEDHANMLYNPLIEGELRFGDTKAYGLELLLRKGEGRLSGWIGYSWSRVLRTIQDINNGNEFPASYDHPNSLFANLVLNTGKRVDISASWIYMTGSPFTSAEGFMQYNGYTVPIYGSKNNDRFPDYHRLDLSVTFRLNKPDNRFKHNLVLSIYNAYGRSNPFSVSFNKIMDDNGNFVVPADLDGKAEIIPTRISVAGIIPSLNYTFKF